MAQITYTVFILFNSFSYSSTIVRLREAPLNFPLNEWIFRTIVIYILWRITFHDAVRSRRLRYWMTWTIILLSTTHIYTCVDNLLPAGLNTIIQIRILTRQTILKPIKFLKHVRNLGNINLCHQEQIDW